MALFRRAFAAIALIALAFALAACGNKEAEQRTAFVTFLQTRILDKPGVRVPKPTDAEKASFGDYAQHYAVISDFNAGMDQSISQPMSAIMAKGSLRSIGDVVARRDDVQTAREAMTAVRGALDGQLAKAEAARAALKQPDDLKAVFDKAYERTVHTPASTVKEVFPAVDAVFAQALEIADYIQQNRSKIEISGASIQVRDAAVQARLNEMLQRLNAQSGAINAAQRKLQSVLRGT
ncbi:MAG: DUF3053 domain-containing protein [Comamonadaceae bacterium]|nr:MAG: DUF3053 domain-containing protein [Comamonadaceae bacterium]